MTIRTEEELEELMSTPDAALVSFVRNLDGPLLVLGAGGKMGPSLARLAKRAAEAAGADLPVIAVARFTDNSARASLEQHGVRTIACDLLDADQVRALPEAENLIYMAGRKFGTSDTPSLTWAMNVIPPVHVLERFPGARISAFSTGTVYPLASVHGSGSSERDGPGPIGEYANACLARERVFEHCALEHGTRVVLLRLNYAVELRYGVLVDIGLRVLRQEPIDLTMGYFNCIWQGDANHVAIKALSVASSPARILNVTGGEVLSVRRVATAFAEHMGRPVAFENAEADAAYLNDASDAIELFGNPSTPIDEMIRWTAEWLMSGGRVLGRPTHFEVRDGRY